MVSDDSIEQALHDLDVQKLLRLCRRIETIAERCFARCKSGRPPGDIDREITELSAAAEETQRIIVERALKIAAPLGLSLTETIGSLGRRLSSLPRDFEIIGLLSLALSATVRGDAKALTVATGKIEAARARTNALGPAPRRRAAAAG
jgi:hypothetical protein